MAIEFLCPECKSGLRVGDDNGGKVVRCGSCMATVRVPEPRPAEPTDAPPRSSDDPFNDTFSQPRRERRAAEPVAPPGTSDRPRNRSARRRPPPQKKGRSALFWVLLVFVILFVLGAATCAGVVVMFQPKWRTHTSDAGGFQVDLPAPPRADMRELARLHNKPDFQIEGTVLIFAGEEYGVMYGDIDAALRKQSDDKILKAVEEGMKKDDPQLRIVASTPTTVSGFSARRLHLTHPEGSAVCLIVVAENRLYMVFGGSHTSDATKNRNIARFIDTFAITDPTLLAKAAARKDKEKREAEAEAEAELEERRGELRAIGEELAERAASRAATIRERLLVELDETREDVKSAGRAAAKLALDVAESQRAFMRDRPDLPVAPPPRPHR